MSRRLRLKWVLALANLSVLLASGIALLAVSILVFRNTLFPLGRQIAEERAATLQVKMEQYFGPAIPALRYARDAVVRSDADLEDWQTAGRRLVPLLQTIDTLDWIYYADNASGRMLGAVRVRGDLLLYHLDPADRAVPRMFRIGTGEELIEVPPLSNNPYEPRERPWFQLASRSQGPTWTPPYRFANAAESGTTAVLPHRDGQGRLLGVFGADVVSGEMIRFLAEINARGQGRTYLLQPDGSLFLQSNGTGTVNQTGLDRLLRFQKVDLSALAPGQPRSFEFYHNGVWNYAVLNRFDSSRFPDAISLVVIPALDIFNVARRNAWILVIATALILALSIRAGLWMANRIAAPLTDFSREMAAIADFNIRSDPPAPSRIHELAVVGGALEKMKASLRAFARYVPSHLVRAVLASGQEALVGGKLSPATMLFADLAGFTSLSEHLAPDDVFHELSECMQVLTARPEAHGGSMLTFLGDGILAVFNAPRPLPDHATAAVRTALDIQEEMERINVTRFANGQACFRARIGINTADVLVGNVGIPDRFAYSAIGDGVNLASRMEGLNKLYGTWILAGEETRRQTGGAFEWREIDRIAVVGRRQAECLHEPLGATGTVAPDLLLARAAYEEGLAHFRDRRFAQAVGHFQEAARLRPQDGAAPLMIKRCREFIAQPPPPRWDGSSIAESK